MLTAGAAVSHTIADGRGGWVQVVRGAVTLDGSALKAGDGAAITHSGALTLEATADAEVLLFDMGA